MQYTIIEIKSKRIVDKQEILDCIIDCMQMRTKHDIDKEKVKEYSKKVKKREKFPNVEIYDDLVRVKVTDGNHRIAAFKENNKYINATLTRDLPEYHWRPNRFTKINYDRDHAFLYRKIVKIVKIGEPNAT